MAEDIADKIRNPDGTLSGTNIGDASVSEIVRGNEYEATLEYQRHFVQPEENQWNQNIHTITLKPFPLL